MNTYTLINDRDGNDTIDIEADTLIDAAIDGLSQLGWSMSNDSSEFRVAKAAPELLEALRRLADWVFRLEAKENICSSVWMDAREAIAKAEGRAE